MSLAWSKHQNQTKIHLNTGRHCKYFSHWKSICIWLYVYSFFHLVYHTRLIFLTPKIIPQNFYNYLKINLLDLLDKTKNKITNKKSKSSLIFSSLILLKVFTQHKLLLTVLSASCSLLKKVQSCKASPLKVFNQPYFNAIENLI